MALRDLLARCMASWIDPEDDNKVIIFDSWSSAKGYRELAYKNADAVIDLLGSVLLAAHDAYLDVSTKEVQTTYDAIPEELWDALLSWAETR